MERLWGVSALLLLSGWNVRLIGHRLPRAFLPLWKYLAHGESHLQVLDQHYCCVTPPPASIQFIPPLLWGFFSIYLFICLTTHLMSVSLFFLPLPSLRLSFILGLLRRPDAVARSVPGSHSSD